MGNCILTARRSGIPGIDTSNVIANFDTWSSSSTYTATEDCYYWGNFPGVNATCTVTIDNLTVYTVANSSGNTSARGYLKKGQTIQFDKDLYNLYVLGIKG